mmetsp:Transcript_20808/g.34395  ORF Transcript_20808/g.34395 Transcript_20808/m.34395 type:complete len:284 (-) Transcript_20808:34-885(-)
MSEEKVAVGAEAAAAVVTKEEMLDLVRAIKFAKPDASMREVHREITERLSKNESFEFLKTIQLNDVKKVWKKAVTESAAKRKDDQNADVLPKDNDVWKLYTVGDGSVKTLAESYSQATAKAVAEEEQQESLQAAALMENYVHVFLDVPANLSGQRPHQALINFNENKSSDGKDKKTKVDNSNAAGNDKGTMVKIQVAASGDGMKHPMLLYSQDRSMKTFIHPEGDDGDGYDRIRTWIVSGGSDGALGAAGGTKAYFYTRVSKRKHGADVLSIDTRELAPPQSW